MVGRLVLTNETTGHIFIFMKRTERGARNRERLLELGLRAFRQDGYAGTSIQDVVTAAGIPKGSFYNYFESKEAFGGAVVDLYVERIYRRLDALAEASGGAEERLRGFFQGLLQDPEHERGCLVGNLGTELGAGSGLHRAALRRGEAGILARFQRLVGQGQEAGSIRDNVSSASLAALLFSAWEGALLRMQVEASPDPPREILDLLFDDCFPPQAAD